MLFLLLCILRCIRFELFWCNNSSNNSSNREESNNTQSTISVPSYPPLSSPQRQLSRRPHCNHCHYHPWCHQPDHHCDCNHVMTNTIIMVIITTYFFFTILILSPKTSVKITIETTTNITTRTTATTTPTNTTTLSTDPKLRQDSEVGSADRGQAGRGKGEQLRVCQLVQVRAENQHGRSLKSVG